MSYDKEFEKLRDQMQTELQEMKEQHLASIRKIQGAYKVRMDKEAKQIKDATGKELETLKAWTKTTAAGVLAAILLAVVGALYLAWRDVNSSIKDVNASVLSLQDKLLSAQEAIQKSKVSLEAATTKGTEAIRRTTKELDAANTDLSNARADLGVVHKELQDARNRYNELARQLEKQLTRAEQAE